jgi:hypothetical protein
MFDTTFEHFEPFMNGRFMLRRGPDKDAPEEQRLNMKLCLTATDQELLAEVLFELSDHPRCRAVKFSVEPKDGMYLGRAFINDADELGRLWQKYKRHPRLMCSIQDDDFTMQYRPKP